jgi:hypothetical protein
VLELGKVGRKKYEGVYLRVKYPEDILVLLPKIVDHATDKSSHEINVKGKFIDSDIIHELDFLKSQLASKMART